jgi:hypothetical protein
MKSTHLLKPFLERANESIPVVASHHLTDRGADDEHYFLEHFARNVNMRRTVSRIGVRPINVAPKARCDRCGETRALMVCRLGHQAVDGSTKLLQIA